MLQSPVETTNRTTSVTSASAKVRIYADLAELRPEYAALFNDGAGTFFSSLPWFENLYSTALNPGERIRIFGVELDDAARTPIVVLPTRYSPSNARPYRIKTLSGLSNFYTSLYEPIRDQQHYSPSHLKAIVQAIRSDVIRWDAIDLKWLDRDSMLFNDLQEAFRSTGMIVQTYFCSGNWYTPVNGMTFKEYFQGLRSSVRNIANSKNKKLERSGRARFEIFTELSDLERAIEAYERVYASSWKVAEPYPQFVPGLIRTCAKQGWLRLGIAYVDNEPAAAQFWIVSHGTASIYKISYDKKFASLSIGSFLTTRMMEYALDVDKVQEIDYLTGDDSYKKDWMSHRRERWGILAMDPHTPQGALAVARHVGGRAVKRFWKDIVSRSQINGRAPARASKPNS